jgi:hypothetical protein
MDQREVLLAMLDGEQARVELAFTAEAKRTFRMARQN